MDLAAAANMIGDTAAMMTTMMMIKVNAFVRVLFPTSNIFSRNVSALLGFRVKICCLDHLRF
jgi:hypothetical protein